MIRLSFRNPYLVVVFALIITFNFQNKSMRIEVDIPNSNQELKPDKYAKISNELDVTIIEK